MQFYWENLEIALHEVRSSFSPHIFKIAKVKLFQARNYIFKVTTETKEDKKIQILTPGDVDNKLGLLQKLFVLLEVAAVNVLAAVQGQDLEAVVSVSDVGQRVPRDVVAVDQLEAFQELKSIGGLGICRTVNEAG